MCLVHVNKNDDDYSPPSRPLRDGDVYVRQRPTSARNSKIITVQHGSHQSVHIPLRPNQSVTRVSSTRVQHSASPVPIPGASRRASYILASDQHGDNHLHHSISPPLIVHAPTPPPAASPRISLAGVHHNHPSPRTTQQSFSQISRHSSHSRRSHHSRSGSSGGRHSRTLIVDPPASETHLSRSRSDAGQRRYSPGPIPDKKYGGRVSMPSIQPIISRERSRERTSTGASYLDPLVNEREIGKIQQGLRWEQEYRVRDGQVKGLLGGSDGGEAVRIVYGRGPRVSAGRLGTHGERNMVFEDGGRRHYGSQ